MKKPALGKGLNALIADLSDENQHMHDSVTELPLSQIEGNPNQPRKNFSDVELQELAHSIQEHGIIQPIVVFRMSEHRYQIIVGERRYRASKIAGIQTIPALIKQDLNDDQIFTLALLENIQREDLNPLETALAYTELMKRLDLTQDSLAKKIGKSRSSVANTLRLLKLPASIQEDILSGRLSEGHARNLASLDSPESQNDLRNRIIHENLTVRDVESKVKEYKNQYPPNVNPVKETLYRQTALEIGESLDVKVKIVVNNKRKGKIELYFEGSEEFEKLQRVLTSKSF